MAAWAFLYIKNVASYEWLIESCILFDTEYDFPKWSNGGIDHNDRIRIRRGGRKKPVPKGATMGKPVHQGMTLYL